MNDLQNKLQELKVKPNKDRGQNFLKDLSVISQIIDFAKPGLDEQILEIGPGLGALTAELAHFPNFTVVEIEEKFCEHLRKLFPRINIINQDFRFLDLADIILDGNLDPQKKITVFGNLPYSFSSEIIFHLLSFSDYLDRAVVMLQKEFSERLAASPNNKDYGVISIFTQLKAETTLGPIISGDSFYPETKVDSQVIELRFFKEDQYQINDQLFFRQVVTTLFSERRKKITNTLKKINSLNIPNLKDFLLNNDFDPNVRPENLTVEDFVKLANLLKSTMIA